jgi:c-di-GMP-binding flagellar brake protein YcgR
VTPDHASQEQRREYYRQPVLVWPNQVWRLARRGYKRLRIEAHILDVSGKGLRLRCGQEVRVHDRLAVAFSLSGQEFKVHGRVAWIAYGQTMAFQVIGLEFEHMSDHRRDRLVKAVVAEQVRMLARG